MFELFFYLLAATASSADGAAPVELATAAPKAEVSSTAIVTTPALVAEPQVATGRFLTALEVKPILGATRGNWVAVRDFNGQDLLYVTHLWAWRCGLVQLELSVNGAGYEVWPLPKCHEDTGAPNAILQEDGLAYRVYERGSIAQIAVRVTYDDLTVEEAWFDRAMVMTP